jgi:aryl-alcohol dehydrogenase-like predicted oxidoreductase
LHRVDPEVPIEETWGAMAETVAAGKAKAIGLSEVTLEELARAQKVHPVASVQSELSLWTRDHLAVVARCAAQNIAFLAYSPLGRGFLTGRFTKLSDFEEGDWRRKNPRFRDEATLKANLALVETVSTVAKKHGRTPAQIALAWALAQGSTVIPIPGTRKLERLEENIAASEVKLDAADFATLDALPEARGTRY